MVLVMEVDMKKGRAWLHAGNVIIFIHVVTSTTHV